jgi:hypothetical protein
VVIPFDLGILGTSVLDPGRALILIAGGRPTIILAATVTATAAGRALRGRRTAEVLAP